MEIPKDLVCYNRIFVISEKFQHKTHKDD